MSYLTQATIADDPFMQSRVTQCAAQQGVTDDPDLWARTNRHTWAAAPSWDAVWESALVAHPEEGYDPGADGSVITDGMILSQVQAMLAEPG